MKKNVVIIGAGLVGSLLGIYLVKRGYRVQILERRGDMRKEKVEAGRSINLALSDRGIRALAEIGIADRVLEIAIPMHGRSIHNPNGSLAFQPYGKQGQFINSVSRRDLNALLMELAEQQGVEILFNRRVITINWDKNEILFEQGSSDSKVAAIQAQEESGEQPNRSQVNADLIFAADGAFSSGRLAHMLQHSNFDYHQYYIDCGYKELSFPAGADNEFLLEKNALHIWPRKDYMLIALPNRDGSFTGTLFFPFQGELSFDELDTEKKVMEFFRINFPDVASLIPDLVNQFFQNSTSSLVTVKCFPWVREDKFCLIGDAAHAIVPFFGQGMNAGFEDCRELNALIGQYDHKWEKILTAFQDLRKPDTDAIADLAVQNFTEMREKTADPKFLLQKKIEARLHEKYPERWIPAYAQVTFSPDIRYSEALKKSQLQEAIMQEIMQLKDIENKWQTAEIEELIISKLPLISST